MRLLPDGRRADADGNPVPVDYLVRCDDCPEPRIFESFESPRDRARWAAAHRADTGHGQFTSHDSAAAAEVA